MPDGGSPLIYKGTEATVIVSGSEESDNAYSVSFDADSTEGLLASKQNIESKSEALKLAETLIKYSDDDIYFLEMLCRDLGLEIY